MPVTITSGGISAVCASIALLIAGAVFGVDALIAKHIRRLNGYYVRSEGAHVTGAELDRRIDATERELHEFQAFTRRALQRIEPPR